MKQYAINTLAFLKFFLISVPLACIIYVTMSAVFFLKNIGK